MRLREAPAHLVQRPSFSLVFWSACVLWLGCLAGEALCGFFGHVLVLCVTGIMAILLVFALVIFRCRTALHPFLIALLFFVLGAMLWGSYLFNLDEQRSLLAEGRSQVALVRIVTDPSESMFDSCATASIVLQDTKRSFLARIYGSEDELVYGQEYLAHVSCSPPSESARASYDRKGIAVRASLSELREVPDSSFGFLSGFRKEFTQKIGDVSLGYSRSFESAALLKALVVGDRTDLFTEGIYQEVKVLGLAHLVAVSGSHLVIVNAFLLVVLRLLHLPRKIIYVFQIAFLFLYLVMVGFPISCIRAACMSIVSLLAMFTIRRSHALSALGATTIVLLALDPSSAFSISFALSVLSTVGIVIYMPLFSMWVQTRTPVIRSAIVDPIAMTFAALLATFPLSIYCFAQCSLIAPICNVIAVPFVSVICIGGLFAFLCMACEPLFASVSNLIMGASEVFCAICHMLSSVPYAAIPIGASLSVLVVLSLGVCVALWLMWPSRLSPFGLSCAAVTLVLAVCMAFAPRVGHEIVMLDVGQGDAFLIRSNGRTLLVDTGNSPQKLLSALSRSGCFHLDALLVTHADDDHCGCIKDLMGIVGCTQVFLAQGIEDVRTDKTERLIQDSSHYVGQEHVRYVTRGDRIRIGAFDIYIVSPGDLQEEAGNQDSICFTLSSDIDENGWSEWSAFFCGDAEAGTVQQLADDSLISSVDVLKVAHHGAEAALTEDLIQSLSPEVALISVGEGNRYGHPDDLTLDLLRKWEVETFRSDISGDVTCSFTIDALTVKTLE